MSKKIVLVMSFFVMLLAVVSAFSVGEQEYPLESVFTQEQIDAVNVNNIRFDFNLTKIERKCNGGCLIFDFNFGMIKKTSSTTYKLVEDEKIIQYAWSEWTDCLDIRSIFTCTLLAFQRVKSDVLDHRDYLKRRITRFKTVDYPVPFYPQDTNINWEE